jgi:hypothetical protein
MAGSNRLLLGRWFRWLNQSQAEHARRGGVPPSSNRAPWSALAPTKGPGCCLCPWSSWSRENRPRARINSARSRAVGTRAVADSAIAAGIDVSRSQHAQQCGATAGTSRTGTPANPGNCSCPLKPIMQRCVFLGRKIVHRTRPPRGETRPKIRPTLYTPLGQEEATFLVAQRHPG